VAKRKTIGTWINGEYTEVQAVIVETGEKLSHDIAGHLKTNIKTYDDLGNPVFETEWIFSPIDKATGKRLPPKTLRETVDKRFVALNDEVIPIVHDIYADYTGVSLTRAARLLEYEEPERFIKRFNRAKSKSYKKVVKEREFTIFTNMEGVTDEYRRKSYNLIQSGINQNKNADTLVRELREDVFGLKRGQKNKGITGRCRMVVNTELSFAETEAQKEIIKQNSDIIGVRLHYYGGPCPSNICPGALSNGRNLKYSGAEISADFYFKTDTVPWPPLHPYCFCIVIRYLYERDLRKLGERTEGQLKTEEEMRKRMKTVEKPKKKPTKIEKPKKLETVEPIKEEKKLPVKTKPKKQKPKKTEEVKKKLLGKPLDDKEKDAIKTYTGSDKFGKLNKDLRGGKALSHENINLTKNIDSALEKLPKYKGETIRNVSFSNDSELNSFLKSHKKGSVVNYKSYTSTSKNTEVFGASLDNVKLKIIGKSGRDISGFSISSREGEVLYPKDTKFTIKSITKEKTFAGTDMKVIEMVEI